jgi:hypothetical protein
VSCTGERAWRPPLNREAVIGRGLIVFTVDVPVVD